MEYLSDTTKKERRNLLAAGFIGIIVAQLKIYPTEIDVVGLKFQSPDLPFIVVGGLCAAITYFMVKFWSSYLFEKSSARRSTLATQIREGKISIDIAREEEALVEEGRGLLHQQKVVQKQQENEERRIKALQDKIDQDDIAQEASLKAMDQKKTDLEQALASMNLELAQKYVPIPRHVRNRGDIGSVINESAIKDELRMLEESRASFVIQREAKRQQDMESLENEKNSRKEIADASARGLEANENAFNEKRKHITEWKQAHKTVRRISPPHYFLEIHLPLLLGAIAIMCLVYLMLHFPPPPKPPSLPEI